MTTCPVGLVLFKIVLKIDLWVRLIAEVGNKQWYGEIVEGVYVRMPLKVGFTSQEQCLQWILCVGVYLHKAVIVEDASISKHCV